MIDPALVLLLGMAVGVWLAWSLATLWTQTQAGRRQQALADAEARIRDTQIAAMSRMADVAGAAPAPPRRSSDLAWPSDLDLEVIVDVVKARGEARA